MALKQILTKSSHGAFWIKFNRPQKKNALTTEMYDEILTAMKMAEQDTSAKVTVFTGSGDFYSSGADFSPEQFEKSLAYRESHGQPPYVRWVDALIDHPKPLIALVNGPAIGISCTTLALFHLVVCSDTAYFTTPFSHIGTCCEGCSSYTFPSIMGHTKACSMLLFGQQLSAHEALQAGLVATVIPANEFTTKSVALLNTITKLSEKSMQTSMNLIRNANVKKMLHEINHDEAKGVIELFSDSKTTGRLKVMFGKKRGKL